MAHGVFRPLYYIIYILYLQRGRGLTRKKSAFFLKSDILGLPHVLSIPKQLCRKSIISMKSVDHFVGQNNVGLTAIEI